MPVFGFQPIPIRSQKPLYLMAIPILKRKIYATRAKSSPRPG